MGGMASFIVLCLWWAGFLPSGGKSRCRDSSRTVSILQFVQRGVSAAPREGAAPARDGEKGSRFDAGAVPATVRGEPCSRVTGSSGNREGGARALTRKPGDLPSRRSEEHTSELQSLMRISYAVFCLKKKTKTNTCTHKRTNNKTT